MIDLPRSTINVEDQQIIPDGTISVLVAVCTVHRPNRDEIDAVPLGV